MSLRYDGQVVVISGAGRGLGRSYALYFGARGAQVVANDTGADLFGGGGSKQVVDDVVSEIRALGGIAVPSYDSVEEGEKVIGTALKAFGRCDVLIHSAGILRDKTFARMSEEDYSLVVRIHILGAFSLIKAAWPVMMKQNYGRIVNTTSPSGLYGSFGQLNYSAAKMGLCGLTKSISLEGSRNNITANAVAPMAGSRMTRTVWNDSLVEAMSPDFVAPLVGYLCHSSCNVTGRIFEAGGGWISETRFQRNKGAVFAMDESFTPSAVARQFSAIRSFDNPPRLPEPTGGDYMANFATNKVEESLAIKNGNPQGPPVRFDGKVVIVTGAGGGLGRSHALTFAKLGAKVVVNDLGGPASGFTGSSRSPAQDVVDEIVKAGGTAVANFDSVLEGAKIVETAIKAFGRVDVLVNNAGIIRPKSLKRGLTEEDFRTMWDVHVTGSFRVTKAVWPLMMAQKSGKIINTASQNGVFAMFGSSNYDSAKAAIIGFSHTLSKEGLRHGIKVNAICPAAATRMNDALFKPGIEKRPDWVTPLVCFLASDLCEVTGGLFDTGLGQVGELRYLKTKGAYFDTSKPFTAEDVRAKWAAIEDFSKDTTPVYTDNVNLEMIAKNPYGSKVKVAVAKI